MRRSIGRCALKIEYVAVTYVGPALRLRGGRNCAIFCKGAERLRMRGVHGIEGEAMANASASAGDADGGDNRRQSDIVPAVVQAELARILASPDFDAPERNRRFLRYVVEEALAGRADRIKAYGIAVAVFDRDDTFDPQSDPIVRIEASRLRRSLERYYLLSGQSDPLRIEIPKGAYLPAFRQQAKTPSLSEAPEPAPQRDWLKIGSLRAALVITVLCALVAIGGFAVARGLLWPESHLVPDRAMWNDDRPHGPAILVVPFVDDSAETPHPTLSQGFTRELIAGLTRFSDLFVFGSETAFRFGQTGELQEIARTMGVDFMLTGGVAVSSERFQVNASLIDATSGRYLWAGRFENNLAAAEIIQVRDDLADQVVRELAQPYGVIFGAKVREIEGRPPQSLSSYECVLHFYKYWKTYDPELYNSVRECLERTVAADNDYADAFASLALIYADAYRFNQIGRAHV